MPKGLPEVFNILVRICRLSGMCSYDLNSQRKFSTSRKRKIINGFITFLVISYAFAIFLCYLINDVKVITVKSYIISSQMMNTFVVNTIFYPLCSWKFYKVVRVIENIDFLDEMIGFPRREYHATKRKLIFNICIFHSLPFLVLIVSFIIILNSFDRLHLLLVYFIYLGYVASANVILLLIFIKQECGKRYKTINENLRKFQNVSTMSNAYNLLNTIDEETENFFGIFLMIKILVCFGYLLSNVYFVISYRFRDPLGIMWCLYTTLEIVAIIYNIENEAKESKKTVVCYEQALKTIDLNYNERMIFLTKVKFHSNTFSACGLYEINWNFFLKLIGSLINSLVILFQFKDTGLTDLTVNSK